MINRSTCSQSKLPLTSLTLALSATVTSGHPGHDLMSNGLHHALASPHHIFALALVGAAFFALGFAINRTKPRRWFQFLGIALVVSAAVWRMAA
jgi:hypothetical protein